MKILFMGSSSFAVPSLAAIASSRHELVAVAAQPDKPAGRGLKCTKCPLAAFAESNGIKLIQPRSVKKPEALDEIRALGAELIAVVAYGKILPRELIDMPRFGCVNVHPSLLPKYRGAAPMNWAIANGDAETGVCTMRITEELDAGNILMMAREPIREDEDVLELSEKLSKTGANLLIETIDAIERGAERETVQDPSGVVLAPLLSKDDGRIVWSSSARNINDRIRAFKPWPGSFTTLEGKLFKIHRAKPLDYDTGRPVGALFCHECRAVVACGAGTLELVEVQLEGRKSMSADEFVRGYRLEDEVLLK